MIRALVDRIESLEQEVQQLRQSHSHNRALVATVLSESEKGERCQLRDKEIREFLEGSS